jgi:hypothetical protein
MRKVHGWRRVLRWVQFSLAGVLGLLILVIGTATIVFSTSWGHGILRTQIEKQLNNTFVGGATLGGVDGNPLTELVLQDLVINGPDHKPAIRVKSLRVALPLLPLISHQLRVDKVIADDVDVSLKRDANGGLQISHLTKPGPKSTWNISLPNVEVHRGHVMFETGQKGNGNEVMDLDNLEIVADAKMPFGGTTVAAVQLSADWRQKQAPIRILASVRSDDEKLAVPEADVRVGAIRIAANGLEVPKVQPKWYRGVLAVSAPAAEVARFAPGVELPEDVALAVTASPDGAFTRVELDGAAGKSAIKGTVLASIAGTDARGFLSATGLELDRLTKGKLDGSGNALATFTVAKADAAEFPTAHGVVTLWGELPDAPHTSAVITVDTAGSVARATVAASNAAGLRAGATAELTKHGKSMILDRGTLVAATSDPAAATLGKAPVHGSLHANIVASGALAPRPDLAVAAQVDGARLRMKDLTVKKLHLQVDAKNLPAHPIGSGRLEVTELAKQTFEVSKLTLAAGNRPDGKIQVSLRSTPKRAPTRVDVDALVTTGDQVIVDLQRHIVRAEGGALWTGNTGRVVIDDRKIEISNLRSASEDGRLAVDGSYTRAGRHAGDLAAKLSAGMDISDLGFDVRGHVDTDVDVKRTSGKLSGVVVVKAKNLSKGMSMVTLDADGRIEAAPGKLVANMSASSPRIGTTKVVADIHAPDDLTKVADWKRLGRDAIRNLDIKLDGINVTGAAELAGAKQHVHGRIDGEIKVTPDGVGGLISARGIGAEKLRDAGDIDAELRVAQAGSDEVSVTANAGLEIFGRIQAEARLATPDRLFDPASWKSQGLATLRGASVRTGEIAFEPGTLERLGVYTNFRGRASLSADLDAGLKSGEVKLAVRDFRGGKIAQPVEIHLDAQIDGKATHATLLAKAGNTALAELRATTPITVDMLRLDPKGVKTAPIQATLLVPSVPARAILTTLGTGQVLGGKIDGRVEIAGTVAKPTAKANIVASDVSVPAGGSNQQAQVMKRLEIRGDWDGNAGNVAITGTENNGGKLDVTAAAAKDALDQATVHLRANKLDLAPIVAFLPGPAGGLGGRLDADLTVRGIDPAKADIAGKLVVTDGRLPIAPAVGTLFHGDLQVSVANHLLDVKLKGKLGAGDVSLVASAPLSGAAPTGGKAELLMHKVQLIGTTEPIITARVSATLSRDNQQWKARMLVDKALIVVPEEKGEKLKPAGVPDDVLYASQVRKTYDPTQIESDGVEVRRRPRGKPVVIAEIQVKNANVESKEVRGLVNGMLHITVADEIGIDGNIGLDRGDLDLFDRRYNVERAMLHFDGSTDPVLDVRITHDFPDVTTITEVQGRMSKPKLIMSSEPGIYSQAELLGFLLGGEPQGDPRNAPSARDKVAGAGESFLANKVAGYVKHALPVDVDVLRYESESANSSAAVTVGTWITHTLFLAYRRHLEARPDENAGEGEIEYWIRRRLVLQGMVGDRGKNGLDLLWRRRF